MLKITIADGIEQRRLIVEGKLVAPWVAELKNAYELARMELQGRDLVIEMSNLTAISQEAENTLVQLMQDGVKFRAFGVFTRHLLGQLASRVKGGRAEVRK